MHAWQKRRATPAHAHMRTPHYPLNEKKGQSLFLILTRHTGFVSDLGEKKEGPAPSCPSGSGCGPSEREKGQSLFHVADG